MIVNLTSQEIDLIVIALKGFVDDNNLYSEQIRSGLTQKDKDNFFVLNMQAEELILKLHSSVNASINDQQNNLSSESTVKQKRRKKST